MTNIEKFNYFIDERIQLASSTNTLAAYTVVKETFNSLFNKPVEIIDEQHKLTTHEFEIIKVSLTKNDNLTTQTYVQILGKLGKLRK